MSSSALPHFAKGEVVKGFGRGSKELGCPTANFSEEIVNNLPQEISTGVYYGFANVNKGPVYKMVMSIGWNPFYKNKKKSMETHVIHQFDSDFYGKELRVIILGFLRDEKNFSSLDELIEAINDDIDNSKKQLDRPEFASYKTHPFFAE
nr:unnamed protein product [Callosobruchus chinensis]